MSDGSRIDRRGFLKEATAAAIAFSALVAESQEKEEKKDLGPAVKLGIIGVGAQGKQMLGELVKMPSAQVVALCDKYPKKFEKALRSLDIQPATYEDYHEMLDKEKDLEAVLIATPLASHAQISLDALKAGKHVLCESILAYSIEECRQVARAAKEGKQVFQVGHQRRCSPLYKHALKFVKMGVLGDLKLVRGQCHMNQSWRRPVKDPSLEKELNWRLYKESSRGLIGEYGSHQMDLVHWYTKAKPQSAAGFGGIDRWKDGREVADNVEVIVRYPEGMKMVLTSMLSSSYGGVYELLVGTHASALLLNESKGLLFKEPDAADLGWELYAKKEPWGVDEGILLDADATKYQEIKDGKVIVKVKEEDRPKFQKSNLACELEEFFRSIREKTPLACDAESALVTAVTSIVTNEAIEKQSIVQFTEDHFKI